MSVKKIATGKWEVRESVYFEGERRHIKNILRREKKQLLFRKNLFRETKRLA